MRRHENDDDVIKTSKFLLQHSNLSECCEQGWQYDTVHLEFAYYVPRTLNRTAPAYRTSVQFLKRTVPTRTIPKKAYRTSIPYFIAKIEAYRTVLPFLLSTTRNFN